MGVVASKTFLDALRFANKAYAVINPSIRLAIFEGKDHVNVDLEQTIPWEETHVFILDTFMTVCHELVSLFDSEIATEMSYFVNYPRPPGPDVYAECISGTLVFDCSFPRISIPKTFCHRPLPMHNPTAVVEAEKELLRLLDRIQPRAKLLFKIKELAACRLGEIPALDAVAASLHLSPRTLSRRLKAIGTSYNEIVSNERQRHACACLCANNLNIDQIASQLGYRDPSNFSKAFKSWTGLSPSQFRNASLAFDPSTKANISDHLAR
jgi:AraC-like DNA-binding protein